MKSKKMLFGVLALVLISFFGCESDNQKDSVNENSNLVARKRLCPEGTSEVWTYEFGSFNFHRPKYNCETGFWFCTTDAHWELDCQDSDGNSYPPLPAILENKAIVYALPDRDNNIISFRFPLELVDKPGNNIDDFRVFNVDDALLIDDMKLVKGNYNTTFTSNQIIVDVPFIY